MTRSEWKKAFRVIHDKLGLKRLIFDGRALSEDSIWAIKYLKDSFEDVKVGLISDGISIEPFIKRLINFPPDWIDVSVDGLEEDHDKQRNQIGAFRKTIETLIQLKESGSFEKINTLTCLTTLNIESVPDMIMFLNERGIKNFFITPVSFLEGYRPAPELRPTEAEFVNFLNELLAMSRTLSDAWLEVDIYEAAYFRAIKQLRRELFDDLEKDFEHLELVKESGTSEVHICYYPSSLTGVREFIVNSDGNIIPPKVMAIGNIPVELVFENICQLKGGSHTFEGFTNRKAFSFFLSEFLQERVLLTNGRNI
jgi:MoaA/NifB/PqqE/SkfB family radical SAM enzyme